MKAWKDFKAAFPTKLGCTRVYEREETILPLKTFLLQTIMCLVIAKHYLNMDCRNFVCFYYRNRHLCVQLDFCIFLKEHYFLKIFQNGIVWKSLYGKVTLFRTFSKINIFSSFQKQVKGMCWNVHFCCCSPETDKNSSRYIQTKSDHPFNS